MRLQAIFLSCALAVGCGGSSDPEVVFVDELSPTSQAALCEDFLDLFCAANTFCDDDCYDTSCTDAAAAGDITAECGPGDVTTDEVLDCGDDGTEDFCGAPGTNGPGCVGDALVAFCDG